MFEILDIVASPISSSHIPAAEGGEFLLHTPGTYWLCG